MIKLTNILDEIRVPPPGIPDLSDWNQNDIDGDPLTFDTPNGSIHAYRLSDTDEYHLDGYYRDGKDMIKQIAEFFDVPIKGEDKTFLTITTGISTVISTSQFKDLMNKAQVELDEIKVTPHVPTRLIIRYYDPSSFKLNNKEEIDYPSKHEAEEAAVRRYWHIHWDNMNTDLSEDDFVKQTTFEDILDNPYENYEFEIESILDEIRIKNPQVDTLDPNIEDLIREYIDE